MTSRSYACFTISAVFAAIVAVIATNLIFDPQGVFGTGLFGVSANANLRYRSLAAYQADSNQYDGLTFGSSRLEAISASDLSQNLGGVNFARFSFPGGMISDYLPFLEYVLREKAERGQHVRTVFLLLDVDSLGRQSDLNEILQFMTPPGLPGQSATRFWWKNLTAVEFKSWRDTWRQSRQRTSLNDTGYQVASARDPSAATDDAGPQLMNYAEADAAAKPPEDRPPEGPASGDQLKRITREPNFQGHLNALRKIVMLCRDAGAELVVASSPLSRENAVLFDQADLMKAVGEIARIVPIWDFTLSKELWKRPNTFRDWSHFRPPVGQAMIQRMFGHPTADEWKDFGRPVGQF
jgi:hypothetical protein